MSDYFVVDHLSKSFGKRQLLKDFSLKLKAQQCLCIKGPSGCGKTTLLRMIAGLEAPDLGRIELEGETLFDENQNLPAHRRNLSLVFQELALWPHLTAIENVMFHFSKGLSKKEKRERALELLNLMQFPKDRWSAYPQEMSGGEKQRVAMARGMAMQPKLLLLDEPFSRCDRDLQEQLIAQLQAFKQTTKLSLICVSHSPEVLNDMSDECIEYPTHF